MPTDVAAAGATPSARLGTFILEHADQILSEWEASARALPSARDLPEPILLDSLPQLLEAIARAIAEHGADVAAPHPFVEEHAFHRLDRGFDLAQVVSEYALLRDAVVHLWNEEETSAAERGAVRILHRAIDDSISFSVDRFTAAQTRAARALDQIATASLESADLDDLLRRLLLVLIETIPAVDTAAILLREGDSLRVRATVGLERDVDLGFAARVGQGFAGKIAAEARPVFVRSATTDPLVENEVIRQRGVRGLYGVPLIDGGSVIGVAHIGSLTAYEFAEQDRRMLEALAARATAAIYQRMLRHDAERRAAELNAVIESIPDAIFIADARGITRANRRGLELLGASTVEELRTGHADMLVRLRARHAATGQTVSPEESGFLRAFRGDTATNELLIERADGEERIIRTAVAPIELDGEIERVVGVATDVTEARRYARERTELLDRERVARGRAEGAELGQRFLSEATAILSASLEYEKTLELVTSLAVPRLADWCALDLVGDDGKSRMVNLAHADPAKAAVTRQLVERLQIRADARFGAPETVRTGRPQLGAEIDDARLATIAENEDHLAILRSLDLGSYLVVPISARGRVLGALTLALSRGSGRRYGPAQLEIAEHLGRRAGLAIENARLYREAQDASSGREQVLAIVSHDLRNPLSVVMMSATTMMKRARDLGDARLVKQAEAVKRSVARMERLITDLLDMASIHAGRLKIEPRPQPVDGLVREAVEFHEALAQQRGIRLRAELDLAPDTRVECDRERVLQALSNLLGNALKFCRPGDQIVLRGRLVGGELWLAVSDTGPGISEAEQRHVFEPYWTAERAGKKGTGLGLFITKGIVEAHGGRLWVESEPGRGSDFVFTLPLARG
jgi:PAS domain S-box-containing protein